MNKFVRILAWICTIFYIAFFVATIVLICLKLIDGFTATIWIISELIQLILLWALDNALQRVATLEEILSTQGLRNQKLIDEAKFGYHEEPKENITYCPVCGYQLFPEDKVCPNCKTPTKKDGQ